MIDRVGFVPPSEATLPVHDIWHIFEETKTHGLIRYRNLFKYERMNSFSKQNLKNRAHGVASIMKNYNIHERTTMSGSIYLDNVVKFESMCQMQPVNGLPFQSLGTILQSIHCEPPEDDEAEGDRTTLYDIPTSNVIEFRGDVTEIILDRDDLNYLLEDNVDICLDEGYSALQVMMRAYIRFIRSNPGRYNNDMLGHMKYVLDQNPAAYTRIVTRGRRKSRDAESRQQFDDDLALLSTLAVDMETPTMTIRLVDMLCRKCQELSGIVVHSACQELSGNIRN